MTPTKTDAAREAAIRKGCDSLMDIDEHWKGCRYPACVTPEHGCAHVHPLNSTIDTYLAKVLEGAVEKIAEIRGRAREDDAELRIPTPSPPDMDFKRWVDASADRETLLTLVTAMEAERDALGAVLQHEEEQGAIKRIALIEENSRLKSEFTAQKAAHEELLSRLRPAR